MTGTSLRLSEELRVIWVLLVGLPACGGLAVGFPLLGLWALRGGPPMEMSDWAVGALVAALSWLCLVVALRAAARAWRNVAGGVGGSLGAVPVLARVAPLLLAVGVAGGGWAAWSIQVGRERSLEDGARSDWCARPRLVGLDDVAACERTAVDCLHLAWEGATADPALVTQLSVSLGALRQRTEREATQAAKGAGYYDGGEVRVIDRLLEQLRANSRRVEDTRVRQAGLLCLFSTGATPGS